MELDYTEYAKIFKVFADPKRLKIIDMLSNGELCACKILEEFQITQPTLSHDMKLLTDIDHVYKEVKHAGNRDKIVCADRIFRIRENNDVIEVVGKIGRTSNRNHSE